MFKRNSQRTRRLSSRSQAVPDRREGRGRDPLLSLVDVGLVGVVMIAPLFLGGRHPLGKLVFVAIVCATATLWMLRKSVLRLGAWRWSGAELLLLLGLALVVLQAVPLPHSALAELSPGIVQALPHWQDAAGESATFGTWSTVSLNPQATRGGLVMFLAYALLFLVVIQRIESIADIERLLCWIAIAVTAMAVLGLVQMFFGNDRFLWIYEYPYRGADGAARGPFSNENHFGHFLALGAGPLGWWLYRALRGSTDESPASAAAARKNSQRLVQVPLMVAITVVAAAGFLTLSRGGIIVMSLAVVSSVAVYARFRLIDRKSLLVTALVGLLIVVSLFTYGYRPMALNAGIIDETESFEGLSVGREKIWPAMIAAITDFSRCGSGIGSHRYVYPKYLEDYAYGEYSHAESGYLQILLEAGLPGLTLLILGLGLCAFWCVRLLRRAKTVRSQVCLAAIVPGIVISITHSAVDFVWYIPACLSIAVILVACACRLHQLVGPDRATREHSTFSARPVWAIATVVVAALGVCMVKDRLPAAMAAPFWDSYLQICLGSKDAAYNGELERHLEQMIELVRDTLERNPNDARAHLQMAGLQLRLFDRQQRSAANALDLSQIRDAAVTSSFPTSEAFDSWLSLAVGENRAYLDVAAYHTRRALDLCPMQGEGYIHAAELAFLKVDQRYSEANCIEQALLVRPHSGDVLLAVARRAALAGDVETTLNLCKRAFRQGPQHRAVVIRLLAPVLPPEQFLAHFQPEVSTLESLFRQYIQLGLDDQARAVAQQLIAVIELRADDESPEDAVRLWKQAQTAHQFLGNEEQELRCVEKAVENTPNDYELRRGLALRLIKHERFDEAAEQLRWCLRRYPGNAALREQLKLALEKGRVASGEAETELR